MGDSAVIVGAGIGGLTAAAYPARAGLDVAVYEQHALPGGYVSLGQTNRTVHERYFRKSLVGRIFDQLGYPVMPGRNTLGMWMTYLNDTWVPSGGMQAFADLLVRFIREHGGQIHLGRAVERIRVEDAATVGVTLADGSDVPARWVVSAADLHHTCFDLIGRQHLPPSLVAKFDSTRPSESVFAVYLGLRGGSELDRALERFQTSHVCFSCADGECVQLALLSKYDPTAAPPGKHVLFVGRLVYYSEWEPFKNDRSRLPRPKDRSLRFSHDLPLERFYAVSHYVFNPGGVPTAMITAWYIAREILKQRGAQSTEHFEPYSVLGE